MILASHQPNFMPYMGYFYKIYKSDVFTLSDGVQFSSNGYHNYNYIDRFGNIEKLTVPVNKHMIPIKDIMLSEWSINREKIKKTIITCYSNCKYYDKYSQEIFEVLDRDYEKLVDLNIALLNLFCSFFEIEPHFVKESDLDLEYKNASKDICKICKDLGANVYLSGVGAKVYIENEVFEENGIELLYSDYIALEDEEHKNLSCLDYVMNNGGGIPKEWIKK